MKTITVAGMLIAATLELGLAQVPDPCAALTEAIRDDTMHGRFDQVERTIMASLAGKPFGPLRTCIGVELGNLAGHMVSAGQISPAERIAERSLRILEEELAVDDPLLFYPLYVLAAARFEKGEIGRAREAYRRMQAIRLVKLDDRVLLHSMGAGFHELDGHYGEAESENFTALRLLEQAGRGESAAAGVIHNELASVCLKQGRIADAERSLDRALNIFAHAGDAVRADAFKALYLRGVLYARQQEWAKAESDLNAAIRISDKMPNLEPVILERALSSYAYVLRKTHRRQEARAVEGRAAILRRQFPPDAMVDITQLVPRDPQRKPK